MNAKNQTELVDSCYKIKQNEAQDDNDFGDNCNFVKTPKSVVHPLFQTI